MTQVFIINMWEHAVGLYHGANLGLLKTVFEVNLSLFQKKGSPKTLLLFVIRDFVKSTPAESLFNTLQGDLNSIWNGLSKPALLKDSLFLDFFDIQFVTLSHKILQPELFKHDMQELSKRLA